MAPDLPIPRPQDIASVKNFELKPVTALLNTFTERSRETMMSVFQHMRTADDNFAQQIYQTTRLAFSKNLRTALEARDAWYREKLRAIRVKHEQQLQAVRSAAAVELAQRTTQMRIAVARVLAKNPAVRMDPAAAMSALGEQYKQYR